MSGKCLCGKAAYTAEVQCHDVNACHCTMCSRWAGGVALFLDCIGRPAFTGEAEIAIYRSSEWGERGFCKVCGSSLFWKVTGEDRYSLSAGTLSDQSVLRLTKEIFIEDQPAYYSFANKTVRKTGEQAIVDYVAADVAANKKI